MKNTFSKVLKFLGNNISIVRIVYVALVLSVGVVWYISAGRISQKSVEEQTLHRQQVVARAGAISLENFIFSLARFEADYADEIENLIPEKGMQEGLDKFVGIWTGTPVSGTILTDKYGQLRYLSDRSNIKADKTDLSDRAYYKWARTAQKGEFYLSAPVISKLGSSKGVYIAPLVVPFFSKGEFNGLIATGLLLSDLTRRYLEPLKLTEDTSVYLIDNNGSIVYSPINDQVGANFFDILNKSDFPEKENVVNQLKLALISNSEGKYKWYLPEATTGKIIRSLVSYSPVIINNNKVWTLAVASPDSVAHDFVWPLYKNQNRMLMFFILSVLGFAFLGLTLTRFTEYKSYLKGYNDGRKKK